MLCSNSAESMSAPRIDHSHPRHRPAMMDVSPVLLLRLVRRQLNTTSCDCWIYEHH